ncbi:MAG: DinB family protein [Anaerolineales bacterium]|nr:DinB family protein [Anaerolineales bacterium]
MDIQKVIQSQYLASLEMLKNAVIQCPQNMWLDPQPKNKFWHIAYHAIFYTHLYLHPSEETFKPWDKHREEYEFMGPMPWPPHNLPKIGEPYTQAEVLEFLAFCQQQVTEILPALDLESDQSGFFWLPFGKLELQFYNIRHVQLHTGELCERLGTEAGIDVDWVSLSNPA